MTKCCHINTNILKWARESAGFELDEMEKSFKKIVAWEKGEDYPVYRQLEQLSVKYKRPLAVFFFPEIPEEESMEQSFRMIPDYGKELIPPSVRFSLREGKIMQINLAELYNGKSPAKNKLITKNIRITKKKNLYNLAKEVTLCLVVVHWSCIRISTHRLLSCIQFFQSIITLWIV